MQLSEQGCGIRDQPESANIVDSRADLSVDNILKGTNRASLPVEQPIKLEFVINLRNDRALGADVLQSCWPVPTR
jgi:hypothetical protein